MRRLIGMSVLGVGLLAIAQGAGVAGADPAPAGQGTLRVQAQMTGAEPYAVAGAQIGITTCAAGPMLTTLTTGPDGTAATNLPPGCYQAQFTSASGCEPKSSTSVKVDVVPAATQTADFKVSCA
ncbi:hypothetical protein F3087_42945 [Nocardia colli]|uniref:Carboxypeptidase regulatory-like domain-containing protein n=1 Tax=Nocardia colli TaxID=2545717 RepID=A0A5N0DRV1_9NOCA|nr:prealbumin-like fold domain-containing protein [Nocardia colli]KAA8879788.1 hypothetical protein F3087_42945 [Nocardia colli]